MSRSNVLSGAVAALLALQAGTASAELLYADELSKTETTVVAEETPCEGECVVTMPAASDDDLTAEIAVATEAIEEAAYRRLAPGITVEDIPEVRMIISHYECLSNDARYEVLKFDPDQPQVKIRVEWHRKGPGGKYVISKVSDETASNAPLGIAVFTEIGEKLVIRSSKGTEALIRPYLKGPLGIKRCTLKPY